MRLPYSEFRRLAWLLLLPFLSLVIGCGSIRLSGALNSSNSSLSMGTVGFVQFTAIFDSKGALIDVTIVTLLVPTGTSTFTFCGNQTSRFSMSSPVQVGFIPGQACSNLIAVVAH